MGTTIIRGSTPTLIFRPLNGAQVSELGEPSVVIAQELVFLTPAVTIDTANNCIKAKLTEAETLQLVEGVETSAEEIWQTPGGDVIRYPVHYLTVTPTIMEEVEGSDLDTPPPTLTNLAPFFAVNPFAEDSPYFGRYVADGGSLFDELHTIYENWAPASGWQANLLPGNQKIFGTGYVFDVKTVASLLPNQNYYLYLYGTCPNDMGTYKMNADLTSGPLRLADNAVSDGVFTPGSDSTFSITFTSGNSPYQTVIPLKTGDDQGIINMPMIDFTLDNPGSILDPGGTYTVNLGMALYREVEGIQYPDGYMQYLNYSE